MSSDQRDRQIQALQERLSRLSEASLRINESLDFDTVLQGVLDSARSLTSARYGVMTLLDDGGGVEHRLTSGFTPAEAEQLWLTPDRWRLFEALTNISEPLRLPDLVEHVRDLGFTEFTIPLPVGVFRFMAAPMFHRGVRVGHVFVGDKENGEEFSLADEQTLVMFASQAALVIANARTHREERRARADLETLVNTSPVGVVVFDARTGRMASFNREALRIVDGLRDDDQPPEDLLEVVTCVRSDGREVSLRELPVAEALSAGETVRAEEIALRVPDGRSVTVLLNATPIFSEEGRVASFVVTLQDMTPLEEQERLRAEFLAMVSHELRTPLAAVKGSITTLLEGAGDLDPAETAQFHRIIRDQSDQMRALIGDLLDVARIETGALPVDPEPADLRLLVEEASSRFVAGGAGNPLEMELEDDLPLVLADRRRVVQVLVNLLSNAAGYSPDGSPIMVSAVRDGVHVAVSVADQGRGIPAELIPELFRKFSRASRLGVPGSGIDGSGLGLAICRGIVEAHGGRIWAESDGPGLGARFTFTLPAVEAATAAPVPASRDSRPAARGKVRVLAVDDNPQDLRYVRDVLTRAGYAPIATGDPADVPRLMDEEKPHLVLLDMVLPGERRHRADERHPQDGGRAGHLPVGLRPGRDRCQSSRHGGRRLRGQALLADGTGGEDQGCAQEAAGALPGRAVGTLRRRRTGHRLRQAPGDAGRGACGADGHGVRGALRACGPRSQGAEPCRAAPAGLGAGEGRRALAGSGRGEEAPPQAGGRRQQPQVHPHRAPRRLPGGGGGDVTALAQIHRRGRAGPIGQGMEDDGERS